MPRKRNLTEELEKAKDKVKKLEELKKLEEKKAKQKQKAIERKERTHRLIETGAIFHSMGFETIAMAKAFKTYYENTPVFKEVLDNIISDISKQNIK